MPEAVAPVAPVVAPKAPVAANGAPKGPQTPVKPAAPVVEAPPQTFKIKVDGELQDFTMADLERYASKGKFADKTVQQAKEAIKKAQEVAKQVESQRAAALEAAKQDEEAFLKTHGIDPEAVALKILERKVREGQMTPEQREAEELKAENARLKAEGEQRTKKEAELQQQTLTTQLQKRIETELVSAAKRAGVTPDSESFFAIYEAFQEALDLGLLPLDAGGLLPHHADRIIEAAQERINGAQTRLEQAVLKGLKGEPLLSRLGPEVVKAVLEARIAQIRGGNVSGSAATAPAASAPVAKPSGYMTAAEADAAVKRLGR